MSQKQPRLLASLAFGSDGPLADLARRAADRVALVDQLRAGLPEALAAELRGANLRDDGTLVLLASSSAWASRLRFEREAVLKAAAGLPETPRKLEVRVAGPAAPGSRHSGA